MNESLEKQPVHTIAGPGWLPMPWMSGLLFVMWLMLAGDAGLGSLLMAFVLAMALPRVVLTLGMPALPGGARGGLRVVRLTLIVLLDIWRSNLAVLRLVLRRPHTPQPAFLWVPIDTDHPSVLTLTACIITMTPGTVSVRIESPPGPDARAGGAEGAPAAILVHALDTSDPEGVRSDIRNRYEKPLLEIFGCSITR